jgi:hypothetical protein
MVYYLNQLLVAQSEDVLELKSIVISDKTFVGAFDAGAIISDATTVKQVGTRVHFNLKLQFPDFRKGAPYAPGDWFRTFDRWNHLGYIQGVGMPSGILNSSVVVSAPGILGEIFMCNLRIIPGTGKVDIFFPGDGINILGFKLETFISYDTDDVNPVSVANWKVVAHPLTRGGEGDAYSYNGGTGWEW